jgi:hypothetical protein
MTFLFLYHTRMTDARSLDLARHNARSIRSLFPPYRTRRMDVLAHGRPSKSIRQGLHPSFPVGWEFSV